MTGYAKRSERMAKPVKEATLYQALDGVGAGHNGSDLGQLREAASKRYGELPVPTWRRSGFWTTNFRALELDALAPRHYEDHATPEIAQPMIADEDLSGLVVQRGSTVISATLCSEAAEQGVISCSLEDAARDHSELFERYFMKRLTYDRDKFEAATAAFWQGGAFLYVPKGVKLERPFQVIYVIDEPGTAQYAHTLAIGDENSEFYLREYDLAPDIDGQALHAGAFELYLEQGARCKLAHFQDWGRGEVYDVSTHVVEVGRDAHCNWIPAHLGGHLTRQHLELATAGKGADTRFRGVYFTEADEHLDLFCVDLHEPGHTTGDVHWKGAAAGKSRTSFEGLIKINPGAQDTHTYLQTHSMMLSSEAKVDVIPSVLVSADQVSASHGGTVGEIDEQLVFYMMSRGLSRPEAVRVIVEGFFEPIVTQLADPALEAHIRERITSKLSAASADVAEFVAAH